MRRDRFPTHLRFTPLVAALLVGSPTLLPAQLISPKTVPVHQGEQFSIYPAQWPGMGGVSIALADTLGDLWSNPAKAARLRVGSVQVMPFTHSATAGGGRSLPVSLLQTGGRLAAGALVTMQEIERRDAPFNATNSERRASNSYYSGVVAARLGPGLAVGAGVSYADLGGVDGVSALYAGSDRLRQSGRQFDARLGLTREFTSGATVEVVAVGHRYRMTHDVRYPETFIWPPTCQPWGDPSVPSCQPVTVPAREEVNLDRTNTAGVHAVYLTPPTAAGWRVGYLLTANRLSHPKIPNYRIQNIPRDPGHTNAFNAGFGLSRALGQSTFALDVILEPMWSHTWADAGGDTTDVNGVVLPQGAHTIDNDFRFRNSRIHVGFAHDFPTESDSAMVFGIQVGLGMRSINYTLDQANHVLRESRSQDEAWTEWTPAFALRLRGRDLELSYAVSVTCGSRCLSLGGDAVSVTAPPSGPGVIAAPNAPLNFDGGSASQHRVMISIRMW
jgi:hypothetical protein